VGRGLASEGRVVTAPLLYVAWDRDGSVHLPANLVGHLHDGVADYLADGDLAALAGLVVEVAGLFDDVECDEADVWQRLVPGDVRARAAARIDADFWVACGRIQRAAIDAEQGRTG
jgi:hypothetical protein